MKAAPNTDHDWIVHSINIHGIFFERWCQNIINAVPPWKVKSINYPVEFPPPNGPLRGKESSLDIRAEFEDNAQRLSLLIECKKNNPDFVNWIFFTKHPKKDERTICLSQIENVRIGNPPTGWNARPGIITLSSNVLVADEAREIRGSYLNQKEGKDKTKTSNAAISDAAHQIALAHQAIYKEENTFCRAHFARTPPLAMPWLKQVFLPSSSHQHIFTLVNLTQKR